MNAFDAFYILCVLFVIWMLSVSHFNLHKIYKREIRASLSTLATFGPELSVAAKLEICNDISFRIRMLGEFRTFTRLFTPKALKRLNIEGQAFDTRYVDIQNNVAQTRIQVYDAVREADTSLNDIFNGPIGERIRAEQASMEALLPDALAFTEKVRAYIK